MGILLIVGGVIILIMSSRGGLLFMAMIPSAIVSIIAGIGLCLVNHKLRRFMAKTNKRVAYLQREIKALRDELGLTKEELEESEPDDEDDDGVEDDEDEFSLFLE